MPSSHLSDPKSAVLTMVFDSCEDIARLRRRSQVVRQRSAKPLSIGSIPIAAFSFLSLILNQLGKPDSRGFAFTGTAAWRGGRGRRHISSVARVELSRPAGSVPICLLASSLRIP